MRRLLFTVSVTILAAAVMIVPLPWLEVAPGPTFEAGELANPEDLEVGAGRAGGPYLVTSVRTDEPTLADTVDAVFDGDVDLVGRASAVPGDIDRDQFIRVQRRLFEEGTRLAWAVGARAAGLDVVIEGTGAEVLAIADGVPAAAELEVGDVIVSIDDQPIRLVADVSTALAGLEPGDEVTVELVRDDERVTTAIELVGIGEMDDPGFGLLLRTVDRIIDMPVDVRIEDIDLVGPSGGLMVALSAYDRLTDDLLTDDLVVAGTGTVDADGSVGPVGGVHQKVIAARDAGADVFLVPVEHEEEALDAADDRLAVIAVSDLDEAIEALQDR